MRTRLYLVLVAVVVMLSGCGAKTTNSQPIPIDIVPSVSDKAIETPNPDGNEQPTSDPLPSGSIQKSDTYLENDFTLGIPMSETYSFVYAANSRGYANISLSMKYDGFFGAKDSKGNDVLLTPNLQPVVFPLGDFNVLEPFIYNGTVYFRVETPGTNWVRPRNELHDMWWRPLGDYGVVISDGTFIIPFGDYNYIDEFVEGKARAYNEKDKNYYIIQADGEVLRTYPVSDKVAPYRLFRDGYIYTRSDVDGHSHAVLTWDGEAVIPYGDYKDDIFPTYLGNDMFLVDNGVLSNGQLSGVLLYSLGQPPRKLSDNRREIISITEGKIITGVIVNGLVGPLAHWEYSVTDYDGNTLIEPGKYILESGWRGGFALARDGSKLILLDADCNEVTIPDGIQITGRYANDAALFVVRVSYDFELWRYADVPARYEKPIGVIDGNLSWVIPPGELEYISGLPLNSVDQFSESLSGDDEGNSLLRVVRKGGQ